MELLWRVFKQGFKTQKQQGVCGPLSCHSLRVVGFYLSQHHGPVSFYTITLLFTLWKLYSWFLSQNCFGVAAKAT
jgi:hypothetical protein